MNETTPTTPVVSSPPLAVPNEDDAPPSRGGGLLDLPEESKSNSNGHAVAVAERAAERERQAQAPVNPYMANPAATHSAPALTQYRPPTSRGLLVALIGGGILFVALFGLVLWLALREPKVIVTPPVVVAPTPAATAPAPIPAPTPLAVAPTPTPPAGMAPVPAPVVAVAPPPTAAPTAPPKSFGNRQPVAPKTTRPDKGESAAAEPVEAKRPAKGGPAEDDDGFKNAFGGGGAPEETKKPEKKNTAVYSPPAPGSGGDVKEELATSDIFEVVVANKPAIAKCADEQHKKDPGSTGKLVMKWTVQTNGRTSAIGVASEEFKGSYIATCIAGLVKTWTFPRHKKQGEPIVFPFKF